jgi:hypothetical protein
MGRWAKQTLVDIRGISQDGSGLPKRRDGAAGALWFMIGRCHELGP